VSLWHEVAYEHSPVGEMWNFCPSCGSKDLETWGCEQEGQGMGFTRCKECGYQEQTADW